MVEKDCPMSRLDPFKGWLSLLFAWTCLSCGLEQDITFDEPEKAPPEGAFVTVAWDENDGVPVFLNDLDKIVVQDSLVCRLWDILLAAGLEEDEILSMRFDFQGEDGYRPSQKGCEPLEGENLELGFLDPESMLLIWDPSLGLPGCYSVKGTVWILGEAAEP
jgi:hypothetical protein